METDDADADSDHVVHNQDADANDGTAVDDVEGQEDLQQLMLKLHDEYLALTATHAQPDTAGNLVDEAFEDTMRNEPASTSDECDVGVLPEDEFTAAAAVKSRDGQTDTSTDVACMTGPQETGCLLETANSDPDLEIIPRQDDN